MTVKNSSRSWSTRYNVRMCCCPRQEHITNADVQNLLKDPSIQLRNLPHTFAAEIDGKTPYAIREMFSESCVPFRYTGCIRGDMLCCGSCTRLCAARCPQDVLYRAYLYCGNIIEDPSRYNESDTVAQMLYDEITSDTPRFFAVAAMVNEYGSPRFNKNLERIILNEYDGLDSPIKYDYAPQAVYEEYLKKHPDGRAERKLHKKANPSNGEILMLDWPRSGVCPFCLPAGMVDRRKTVGNKSHRGSRKK